MAPITVGDTLPDTLVKVDDQMESITTIFNNKRGVIFAVPGAFTPTCSEKHFPGFVERLAELQQKGMQFIGCLATNDAFVMKAWKKDRQGPDSIAMISDGNCAFTKAIGMELDLTEHFLGIRSKRYAMIISPGGKVEWIGFDDEAFIECVLAQL